MLLGVSGKALGGKPTKTSTHPITLRGQDKKMQPILGVNPNKDIEDEYIHNLQQQMHFMEMELKLLKEKVIEDEKSSGIGSLFNDEKSSYQHIDLLRQKYNQMRRDYIKKVEEMEKEKLRILGDQFVLDAQINIMSDVNNKMEDIRDKDEKDRLDKIKELETRYRELYRMRKELEEQLKRLKIDLDKQKKDNYNHKLHLEVEKAEDDHDSYRHERDIKAAEDRFAKKEEELKAIDAALDNIQKQFEANPEYQEIVQKSDKYIEDAKGMYVDLYLLKVQVKEMEAARDLYEKTKEDENKRKRKLIEKNKDLKKEADAKDQTERMRTQKLMNETKNPDLRELMLNNQKISESVNELEGKLQDEKDKYDKLQAERVVLDRRTELMTKDHDKYKQLIEEGDKEIGELKAATNELQGQVNGLEKQQIDSQVLNKEVEGKYRKLAKTNVALKAKLHFLLSSFDYSKNVKSLNLEDFRSLINSNSYVNEAIGNFMERLTKTKDDVFKFESEVEAKGGTI
jgi:hypothetical protein